MSSLSSSSGLLLILAGLSFRLPFLDPSLSSSLSSPPGAPSTPCCGGGGRLPTFPTRFAMSLWSDIVSGKGFLVDHCSPEHHWSTTQHHGPASAPGPLLVHLDPAWSTLCNQTPEIADQGGSRWTRRTTETMELGVEPGALWSRFYVLLMWV